MSSRKCACNDRHRVNCRALRIYLRSLYIMSEGFRNVKCRTMTMKRIDYYFVQNKIVSNQYQQHKQSEVHIDAGEHPVVKDDHDHGHGAVSGVR